ncbi:MAG: hypothetical protein HLX50_14635 [Alteromonadaceae bacterium]|nr:hypothetical protein [Alteromonadaceae bacterium]
MKVKFLAKDKAPDYQISGETINELDLSIIEHGGQFVQNETTRENGIFAAERTESGELYVTLAQDCCASRWGKPAHWRESDYIDPETYDSGQCYIVPTNFASDDPETFEVFKCDDGWCVRKPEVTEDE